MKSGKLTPSDLTASVFRYLGESRPEVLVHAGLGEDCSVLDLGGDVIVVSTDPITGTTMNIGRLSVIVSSNDVASCGAEPVGILVSILAPEDSDCSDIEEAMRQVDVEARAQGIEVIGGHTEITDSVSRMVICSTVIGKASRDMYVTSSGARPGDSIIVTKSVGLEGTAILAHERAERLAQLTSPEVVARAQRFFEELSVVSEGLAAVKAGVSAMHDATEGGFLGALYELALASGVGFELDLTSVPMREETRLICEAAGIDSLKLMSSGSMIITTPEPGSVRNRIESLGISAAVVGKITADRRGFVVDGRQRLLVDPPESDQLYAGLANLNV